ncbi:MAG: hypothetical protein IT303_18015 [Dehalococcoidia bacterium]|nr:hypothetical protein [Dehalococcoidia bacterium]
MTRRYRFPVAAAKLLPLSIALAAFAAGILVVVWDGVIYETTGGSSYGLAVTFLAVASAAAFGLSSAWIILTLLARAIHLGGRHAAMSRPAPRRPRATR